jgi:hypothetical protein
MRASKLSAVEVDDVPGLRMRNALASQRRIPSGSAAAETEKEKPR